MDNQKFIAESFYQVFDSIDEFAIKKGVDEMGIDKFISHCALLAAGTGAANGLGGFTTMIVGVPVDVVNNIFQQFRVTLAVIYYKKRLVKHIQSTKSKIKPHDKLSYRFRRNSQS